MVVQAPNLRIDDAYIMFRNFAGAERPFNSEGDRNFCVFLDDEQADQLKREGWNIKQLRPKEEGDEPQKYLQVKVQYGKGQPPRVVLVSSKGKTDLGADEISILDYIQIKKADILLRPYHWDVQGNQGIKAYLKTAFITLDEDELELAYADLEDVQDPTNLSSLTATEEKSDG